MKMNRITLKFFTVFFCTNFIFALGNFTQLFGRFVVRLQRSDGRFAIFVNCEQVPFTIVFFNGDVAKKNPIVEIKLTTYRVATRLLLLNLLGEPYKTLNAGEHSQLARSWFLDVEQKNNQEMYYQWTNTLSLGNYDQTYERFFIQDPTLYSYFVCNGDGKIIATYPWLPMVRSIAEKNQTQEELDSKGVSVE
jgi:hypothetical protein